MHDPSTKPTRSQRASSGFSLACRLRRPKPTGRRAGTGKKGEGAGCVRRFRISGRELVRRNQSGRFNCENTHERASAPPAGIRPILEADPSSDKSERMRETGRKSRTHGFQPVPTPSSRLWKTLLFHVENPHCAAWGSVGKWVSATSHAEGAFRRRAVWHARSVGAAGAQVPYKHKVTGSNPVPTTTNFSRSSGILARWPDSISQPKKVTRGQSGDNQIIMLFSSL